jgi:transcriptional regulator with XRE-family HTH domain
MSAIRSAARAVDPASVLAKAVLAAASRLSLRQKQLAAVLGASEASISRLQRGRPIDPATKEGELALLFLRIYRSLDALVGGDDERARAWLHAQNDHLGGVPAERMRQVQGLVDVAQYLDSVRGRL